MADTDIVLTVDLDVKDAEKTAENLQKEVKDIFSGRGTKQAASLTNLEIQMKRAYEKADELRENLVKLGQDVPTEAYSKVLKDIEEAESRINDISQKLSNSESLEDLALTYERVGKAIALVEKEGTAGIQDTEGWFGPKGRVWEVDDLKEHQAWVKHVLDSSMKLRDEQDSLNKSLGELLLKKKELEDANSAVIIGKETTEYQKTEQALDGINDKLKQQIVHYRQIQQEAPLKEAKENAAQANLETIKANSSLMAMNMAIRSIGRIIPGVSTTAISGVVMLTRAVMRLTNLTKVQLVSAINAVKAAFAKLFAFLMAHPIILIITAITAAVVALVNVFKGMRNEIEEQLDAIGEKLADLFDKFKDLAKEIIPTLIRGFIRLGDALPRTLLTLVRGLVEKLKSLKSTIKENLDLMAQWNEGNNAVNTALSNLTSSLAYLKASLATVFAPILTYVEPVLTHLTDLIAEAVNVIGMFIAKLTGATSYTRAIRVQTDYAESLDKTAKSAKKATGALASFDKLNVINDNESALGAAKSMDVDFKQLEFKNTPLPDWLDDFEKLGKKLSKKINKFLKGIDWGFIKEKAATVGKDIAKFLNGLEIGGSLGTTLGEGLNTITITVNSFLDEFKGLHFGEQLGELIENAVKTINWFDIGKIFSGGFNTLCDIIRGLADTVVGEDLGKAFTDFLDGSLGQIKWDDVNATITAIMEDVVGFFNTAITPKNFELIGTTLGNILNTIMTGINVFVNQAQWDTWGQSVADGVMALFNETDWVLTAKAIGNLALGLLKGICAAVDELTKPENLDKIIQSILDFFENVPWDDIRERAKEISEKLRDGLTKIWEALKTSGAYDQIIKFIVEFLEEKENWEKLFAGFKADVVGDVFWGKVRRLFERVGEHIRNFFNAIGNGIRDFFSSIGDWFGSFSDASGFVNVTKAVGNNAVPYFSFKVDGYANGAVLPPNKPFLGVLGDQKNGTNIEAPLDTIKQAVAEVISTMGINVVLDVQGDPKKIFKATQQEAKVFYKQTGKNAFANT